MSLECDVNLPMFRETLEEHKIHPFPDLVNLVICECSCISLHLAAEPLKVRNQNFQKIFQVGAAWRVRVIRWIAWDNPVHISEVVRNLSFQVLPPDVRRMVSGYP